MNQKIDNKELAAFDYLEKCRFHGDMYDYQNDRLMKLLSDRRTYIAHYRKEDYKTNERIQMAVEFILKNNSEIKAVLNIP